MEYQHGQYRAEYFDDSGCPGYKIYHAGKGSGYGVICLPFLEEKELETWLDYIQESEKLTPSP